MEEDRVAFSDTELISNDIFKRGEKKTHKIVLVTIVFITIVVAMIGLVLGIVLLGKV